MALTYGEIAETLTGISLSISADMMLFGTSKTAGAHIAEMVAKMSGNEAKHRGVSIEDVFKNSPADMLVNEETEAIWHDYLSAFDKSGEDEDGDGD